MRFEFESKVTFESESVPDAFRELSKHFMSLAHDPTKAGLPDMKGGMSVRQLSDEEAIMDRQEQQEQQKAFKTMKPTPPTTPLVERDPGVAVDCCAVGEMQKYLCCKH